MSLPDHDYSTPPFPPPTSTSLHNNNNNNNCFILVHRLSRINMKIVLLLLVVQHVYGSPFELTEKYIEEFNVGIKNLRELSENYVFQEEHLDPTVLNEEEAAKSKRSKPLLIFNLARVTFLV